MKTGPLTPISRKAIMGMDRISKILAQVPQEEWEFVLKQAKDVAMERLATKSLKDLYKKL